MALQNFVDKVTTVATTWLNSVDVLLDTVFGTPTTKAQARAALTSDAPMSLGQGGTGATTAGAARTALGSTATGDAVFTAASAAAARTTLGSGATGDAVFTAATAASARTTLDVEQSPNSSGKVQFPAVQIPSADPNALDDYAEGTFTPSLGGTTTYTIQSGFYTKIGRLVTFQIHLTINVIGTGSTSSIGGLPFTSHAIILHAVSVGYFAGTATNILNLWGGIPATSNNIQLYSMTAVNSSPGINSIFQNGTIIDLTGSYII